MKLKEFLKIVLLIILPFSIPLSLGVVLINEIPNPLTQFIAIIIYGIMISFLVIKWVEFLVNKEIV